MTTWTGSGVQARPHHRPLPGRQGPLRPGHPRGAHPLRPLPVPARVLLPNPPAAEADVRGPATSPGSFPPWTVARASGAPPLHLPLYPGLPRE